MTLDKRLPSCGSQSPVLEHGAVKLTLRLGRGSEEDGALGWRGGDRRLRHPRCWDPSPHFLQGRLSWLHNSLCGPLPPVPTPALEGVQSQMEGSVGAGGSGPAEPGGCGSGGPPFISGPPHHSLHPPHLHLGPASCHLQMLTLQSLLGTWTLLVRTRGEGARCRVPHSGPAGPLCRPLPAACPGFSSPREGASRPPEGLPRLNLYQSWGDGQLGHALPTCLTEEHAPLFPSAKRVQRVWGGG